MPLPKSPVDRRPFQSKADRERQQSLEANYRSVAIRDVAAALRQPAPEPQRTQGAQQDS